MITLLSFIGKITRDNLDIFVLRVGLGLVFLYAGTVAMQDPTSWIGFVPQFVQIAMPRETFLFLHSIFQIGLGTGLIIGAWIPVLSILAFLSMFSILTLFGIDDVTFRDFGLACMALALFVRVTYRIRN